MVSSFKVSVSPVHFLGLSAQTVAVELDAGSELLRNVTARLPASRAIRQHVRCV